MAAELESVGDRGGSSKVFARLSALLANFSALAASIDCASVCLIGTPPRRPRGARVPRPLGVAYLLTDFDSLDMLPNLDILSTADEVSVLLE